MPMLKKISVLLLAVLALSNPLYAYQPPAQASHGITTINHIVMFGDSLSDNGNVFQWTQRAEAWRASLCKLGITSFCKFVIPLIPNKPYYEGHFSNGEVWGEKLAEAYNINIHSIFFSDNAFGGAWAEESDAHGGMTPPLPLQVSLYEYWNSKEKGHVDKYLYTVWIGGNDYLVSRQNVDEATTKSVDSIQKQLESIIQFGAKNILVVNLPDLGKTPYALWSPINGLALNLTQLSNLHNKKLKIMLDALQLKYPNVNLVQADIRPIFDDILAHPEKYHLKNTTQACWTGGYAQSKLALPYTPAATNDAQMQKANAIYAAINENPVLNIANQVSNRPAVCDQPDDYLYWDLVHPTQQIHALLANEIFKLLHEHGIY